MTLQQLREKAGYESAAELARAAGVVTISTVNKLEAGIVPNPRYDTVEALAAALNTTTEIVVRAIRKSVKDAGRHTAAVA